MQRQYEIICEALLKGISGGIYPEGSWLPPAPTLAKRSRCSTHAVRRAFRVLSDRGILKSTKKKGTCVLRRPPAGWVVFMLSADMHTNTLLQEPVSAALVSAGFDVEFLPFVFRDLPGFERLRALAGKRAADTVLVSLGQDQVPDEQRPAWEKFAAAFRGRVGFQFEEHRMLPESCTVLPDPVAAARLVAEHLLASGHRRIGVVSADHPGNLSAAARRAAALMEVLEVAGAVCAPYCYGLHAGEGVAAFVRRNRCTAWWAVTDHQALEHALQLMRAGLRVPEDVAVVGHNDTPWATSGAFALTTLSLNPVAVAEALVQGVRAQLAVDRPTATQHYSRPRLVVRGSTAVAAVPVTAVANREGAA
jgi:DNA-binding transcriptional regulator YhcF (GntR family)